MCHAYLTQEYCKFNNIVKKKLYRNEGQKGQPEQQLLFAAGKVWRSG